MSVPENASLYPFFTLSKGQTVRFTALDPTDNSDVTDVVITAMVLGVNQDDTVLDQDLPVDTPWLVPVQS